MTLETTPRGAKPWSTRPMAKKLGRSHSTVGRVWRAFNLKPHRTESFSLSNDPFFVEEVRNVVGLYMSPPDNAMVLCVDEKSQIQPLDALSSYSDPRALSTRRPPTGGRATLVTARRLNHRAVHSLGRTSRATARGRPSTLTLLILPTRPKSARRAHLSIELVEFLTRIDVGLARQGACGHARADTETKPTLVGDAKPAVAGLGCRRISRGKLSAVGAARILHRVVVTGGPAYTACDSSSVVVDAFNGANLDVCAIHRSEAICRTVEDTVVGL